MDMLMEGSPSGSHHEILGGLMTTMTPRDPNHQSQSSLDHEGGRQSERENGRYGEKVWSEDY